MDKQFVVTSIARNAPFNRHPLSVSILPSEEWARGDFVVGRVLKHRNALLIELTNGRMVEVAKGNLIVGSFGTRFATMEATGSWEYIEADGFMHMLTGAGLFGRATSKSFHIPPLISLVYEGHVMVNGSKTNMLDYVDRTAIHEFNTPCIIVVGTTMSAGKTTTAKVIIRLLKEMNLTVVGAKLTGAGRYKDILHMQDAGADAVFDFVDVGLPSSICPEKEYLIALRALLSKIEDQNADVAVIEIGASPLEPYNGKAAIDLIQKHIRFSILCASDPYAVYGVMKAFQFTPELVSGVATNTLAGIELIEKLCRVRALNVLDPEVFPELKKLLGSLALGKSMVSK